MIERVHGDIRHLEIVTDFMIEKWDVHGDIRHLEMDPWFPGPLVIVHGDIRHLEIFQLCIS